MIKLAALALAAFFAIHLGVAMLRENTTPMPPPNNSTIEVGPDAPKIWVYQNNANAPTLVWRDEVSDVHDCRGGDCLARLDGDNDLIWVRQRDFSR